jgi:glucokinase
MSEDGKQAFLGFDIGGTKIGLSVGQADGRLIATDRVAIEPDARPEALLDAALARIDRTGVTAIGCSCAGPMSGAEGRFLDPPNLPRWHGFELRKFLEGRTGLPVAMGNDANASVLAEVWWGAAQGARTAVFLTMSTGMGAGLFVDGNLFEGGDELAGEIGHIRLDPDGPVGFGKRGSVEGYLSGPGLVQLAQAEALAALQVGEATGLLDAGRVRPDLTAEALCALAALGDAAALRAVGRSADALGRLLALLTDLLNPDVFVLGTIGAAWPDLFIPRARAVLEREGLQRAVRRARIVPSNLGERRGHLAALAVAVRAARRSP